jgi:hypothetical protein
MRAGGRRRHVHQRRSAGDRNRLGQRADFHHRVQPQLHAGAQTHLLLPEGLKPAERVFHGIYANRQRHNPIFALRISDFRDRRSLQGGAGHRDGDAGQNGTAFIRDAPDETRGGLLRDNRDGVRAQNQTKDQYA